MNQVKFSYKEALAHGWAMTKKNMVIIFACMLIYISFNAISGILGYFAGSGSMSGQDVRVVYRDPAQAKLFYQYLQETGYINKYGVVLDKLQQVSAPADLPLSLEFEGKRKQIYEFLNRYQYRLPFPRPIYFGLAFLMWVISMIIAIGIIKLSLAMSRDEEPYISDMFTNSHLIIPYVLGGICYVLAVLGGLILLIIPGFIFMLMFQFYAYLIIDKGMGPIEALKRSREITKGSKGRLAIFGSLIVLVNLGGLLCLLVGLFLTVPMSSIAMAYVYDRLENT